MLQSSVSCDMLVLCFMFLFYVIITNTMAYWYDGAALAATRSPVIALFWCLIKFTTTTTTTKYSFMHDYKLSYNQFVHVLYVGTISKYAVFPFFFIIVTSLYMYNNQS